MTAAKSSTARSIALRERNARLGRKRRECSATDAEWRVMLDALRREREKGKK